ncbi:hypothetical protein [Desulfococcus sp.]|uniref:hypothetical protein n=1 Tax=Desulfococcus sp. TaxID=2025834 RepID=UPI0035930DB1
MDGLTINVKNTNLAVISKLLNSACAKYECSVTYNPENNSVHFSGDDSLRAIVIEDTMNLFRNN